MGFNSRQLAETVQKNCHIADARHGADYTLCIYLMKMREYYRWEQGFEFSDALSKDGVGDWLVEREALWESLDEADFETLPLHEGEFDPFDANSINDTLQDEGMVYGGGLGRLGRPHFFLAKRLREEHVDDYSLLVSGQELARDLTAPPAMSLGKNIYIRRESLKRLLWERLENWRWSSPDNAMGRALACYDFDNQLEESLERMTDAETDAVLWHEIGEVQAGSLLGDAWSGMLNDLLFTPAELMVRAVRDHLADCLVTLPRLLEREEAASIHFYMGSLSNMRKEIFPSLQNAYEVWRRDGAVSALTEATSAGYEHWLGLSQELLSLHQEKGNGSAGEIAVFVEQRHL